MIPRSVLGNPYTMVCYNHISICGRVNISEFITYITTEISSGIVIPISCGNGKVTYTIACLYQLIISLGSNKIGLM